jgi:hypothetical protein
MKVRILSGNQCGSVVEMPRGEAEVAIATGYAEAVLEDVPAVGVPRVAPKAERTRARWESEDEE